MAQQQTVETPFASRPRRGLCPMLHLAEELIDEAPKSIQARVSDARTFLTSTATGKGITIAGGLFLAATLAIALYRTYQKYSSPRAQRMRVVSSSLECARRCFGWGED